MSDMKMCTHESFMEINAFNNGDWTKEECQTLRDTCRIFFSGEASKIPVLLVHSNSMPQANVVLGYENEGIITFRRPYGVWYPRFSTHWIPGLIKDLTDAKAYSEGWGKGNTK